MVSVQQESFHKLVSTTSDHYRNIYGYSAGVVGLALAWFSIWTVTCNVLVLSGFHYGVLPWTLLTTTVATTFLAGPIFKPTKLSYKGKYFTQISKAPSNRGLRVAVAVGIAIFSAALTHKGLGPFPYIAGTISIAAALWPMCNPKVAVQDIGHSEKTIWKLATLFILVLAIYYFSHRADQDDSSYINLAVGAQRSAGTIFQFDTMLGDGPNPIWLPEYKFQSFELLAAAVSSVTLLKPIVVFHLVLPLPELALLTLIFMLTLLPVCGELWLAAAVLWIAFLFVNETTLASWGVHGIIRFFQGKAFLVTALVPLIAALTIRWFRNGQRIDLIALSLCNISAVGFHISGLFVAPAASAFVGAAFVVASPKSKLAWLRLFSLVSTITYQIVVACLIIYFRLALPSEVTETTNATDSFNFVVTYGVVGIALLMLLALSGMAFFESDFGRVSLIYIPSAMILTLNPFSWRLISSLTGNLGFRIFWSLPAGLLSALSCLALLHRFGLRSERQLSFTASLILVSAIGLNAATSGPSTAIHWHLPDLKVDRPEYDLATRLEKRTVPGCRILAPEAVSLWLTTMPDAPFPVFARSLYLYQYRFTMPAYERETREKLRSVVDGDVPMPITQIPSMSSLKAARLPIGTIAVFDASPNHQTAELLAHNLNLSIQEKDGPLSIWSGQCKNIK